ELMAGARYLLMNSTTYEGFPLVLVEALAGATPCLVPKLGAMPDIIPHEVLGRHFTPGDKDGLIREAQKLWEEAPSLRKACRAEYELKYTPEINFARLKAIYTNLLAGKPPGVGL
ncbi:MAG: glycosyltransferase, partial [Planctomycetes bacterium]|nr:glycosyltransferase [Planctomycetota bacterium]